MNKNCDTELAIARISEVPLTVFGPGYGYGNGYGGYGFGNGYGGFGFGGGNGFGGYYNGSNQ